MTTAAAKQRYQPAYETIPAAYRVLKWLVGGLLHIVYHREVIGQENFPRRGPVIVVANHLHLFDPPVLMLAMPRDCIWLAADKWQRAPIIRTLLRIAGAVFVRRGEVDRQALRLCIDVLAQGDVLALAPEGTRSKTGSLQRAKPGVAYLAVRSKAPIVPIAFWGAERLRDWLRLKRPTCKVVIGCPFKLPELSGKLTTEKLQELADLVMIQIGLLLPEGYRGVYAERCAAIEAGESDELSVLKQDAQVESHACALTT